MNILTDQLRQSIPLLGSQRDTNDPVVYAKLFIPNSSRVWYVTEGEQKGDDYIFFVFENCPHYADLGRQQGEELPLSFLFRASEIVGSHLERDSAFTPKRLSTALLHDETALV
jgi:hypothetical protein